MDRRGGAAVRDAVSAPLDDPVVGHHDWSAKHVRWHGDTIAVVYDWDSILRDSEANLAGYASAVFTATWELDVPRAPSPAEADAFVRAVAARAYLTAYVARCELSDLDGPGDFCRALSALVD